MKSIEFFINKTTSFLDELRGIELVSLYSEEKSNDIYNEPLKTNGLDFKRQTNELNEIKFQMNLMFSEFDNGKLFIERLNKEPDANYFFDNSPYLNHLIDINELFIDFLNEYRVE